MKRLLITLAFISLVSILPSSAEAQKSPKGKRLTMWIPTKESSCRVNQLQTGVGSKLKIIKVNASYSWSKKNCLERDYVSPIKIKVKKGLHLVNGREYYSDGEEFYEVKDNTCSAVGISKAQVFK